MRSARCVLDSPLALQEGGQHTGYAIDPGQQIADGNSHLGRLAWLAGDAHEACLSLGDLVVARPSGLGTIVTEPGDGEDYQAWVELQEACQRETEPVQDSGPEVLEEDIGMPDQPLEQAAAFVALEIDDDRFLVPVAGQEIRRLPSIVRTDERRPPTSGVIARAGGFDLDHPCTQVAQHHACMRPAGARVRSTTT
jgi:hypothetical protein